MSSVVAAFAYDSLPAEAAADLRAVADRIRDRGRRATADLIEIGRDLIAVKKRLEHGAFLAWIESEFTMTDRTARNFMQAAAWAEGKSETISDLPPTTVYLLSAPSTPPEVANKVVVALEAGQRVAPEIVSNMVKQARREADERKRKASQKELRRKRSTVECLKAKERQAERERKEAEERERALNKQVAEAVALLRKRLTPAELARAREILTIYGVGARIAAALEDAGNVVPLHPDAEATP